MAEALGTATGFPFGAYSYSGTLGWEVLDVPVVIPLAWTMMAWPMLLLGRRLSSASLAAARGGATWDRAAAGRADRRCWAVSVLASWDLYLDPQMTDGRPLGLRHPRARACPACPASR